MMEELIERLGALEGPDWGINEEIDALVGWAKLSNPTFAGGLIDMMVGPNGEMQRRTVPAYTSSLDAAMTLVPEGASWDLRWWSGDRKCWVTFYPPGDDEDDYFHIHGIATPALALCAAALRARLTLQDKD